MGRSVIVTGAGHGVGRAVARQFARSKDRLILTARDPERGRAVAEEINEGGGEAVYVEAKLHQKIDVRNVIAETLDSYGRVDVLAHCSTNFQAKPLLETTEEDFQSIIDRNIRAAYLTNRMAAAEIVRTAEADDDPASDLAPCRGIVNLVSTEAMAVSADHALFAASQGAIIQLTKAVALTLADYGARANAVSVSGIASEIDGVELVTREDRKAVLESIPLGRVGKSGEAASAIHYLASPKASFITGQTLVVDGGTMARFRAAAPKKDDASKA